MYTLKFACALVVLWFVLSVITRGAKTTKGSQAPQVSEVASVPATEPAQMLASDLPPALVDSNERIDSADETLVPHDDIAFERRVSQYSDFAWFRPLVDLSQLACTWVVEQYTAHRPTVKERIVDTGLAMAGIAYGYGPNGRVILDRTPSRHRVREPMAIRIEGNKRARSRVIRAMQVLRNGDAP